MGQGCARRSAGRERTHLDAPAQRAARAGNGSPIQAPATQGVTGGWAPTSRAQPGGGAPVRRSAGVHRKAQTGQTRPTVHRCFKQGAGRCTTSVRTLPQRPSSVAVTGAPVPSRGVVVTTKICLPPPLSEPEICTTTTTTIVWSRHSDGGATQRTRGRSSRLRKLCGPVATRAASRVELRGHGHILRAERDLPLGGRWTRSPLHN